MIDLTRRQAGIGAISMLTLSAFPAPIAKAIEAGDACEFAQRQLIREVAEAYANFQDADRNFFVSLSARNSWNVAHHELARLCELLRIDPIGDLETRRMIRGWIDMIYPSPAIRAYHVPRPLQNLSQDFSDRQAELDAITLGLGEADYHFARYKRQSGMPRGSKRYRELWSQVSRAHKTQDPLLANFSRLHVETPDDKIAALRATMMYHSCYQVRSLNARRTWWLRSHGRS